MNIEIIIGQDVNKTLVEVEPKREHDTIWLDPRKSREFFGIKIFYMVGMEKFINFDLLEEPIHDYIWNFKVDYDPELSKEENLRQRLFNIIDPQLKDSKIDF